MKASPLNLSQDCSNLPCSVLLLRDTRPSFEVFEIRIFFSHVILHQCSWCPLCKYCSSRVPGLWFPCYCWLHLSPALPSGGRRASPLTMPLACSRSLVQGWLSSKTSVREWWFLEDRMTWRNTRKRSTLRAPEMRNLSVGALGR